MAQVYAAFFEGGMGYRIDKGDGVAVKNEPESMCAPPAPVLRPACPCVAPCLPLCYPVELGLAFRSALCAPGCFQLSFSHLLLQVRHLQREALQRRLLLRAAPPIHTSPCPLQFLSTG